MLIIEKERNNKIKNIRHQLRSVKIFIWYLMVLIYILSITEEAIETS